MHVGQAYLKTNAFTTIRFSKGSIYTKQISRKHYNIVNQGTLQTCPTCQLTREYIRILAYGLIGRFLILQGEDMDLPAPCKDCQGHFRSPGIQAALSDWFAWNCHRDIAKAKGNTYYMKTGYNLEYRDEM